MVPQPVPRRITESAEHLQVVREGMMRVVHGPGGTARNISGGLTYHIAGKTGTAQVVSRRGNVSLNPRTLPMHLRHRALFVGYAPAENPTIAVAVVVEGGGFGASTAAPIARKILDAWVLGKLPEGVESVDAATSPAATGTTPATTTATPPVIATPAAAVQSAPPPAPVLPSPPRVPAVTR